MIPKKPETVRELTADELRWHCQPSMFDEFRNEKGNQASAPIGQRRAIDALRLGLEIDAPGHNIFVCGPSGTGKMSTVRSVIAEGLRLRHPLVDCIYVQNFSDNDRPILLTLPAGQARSFKREFEAFTESLPELIRSILDAAEVEKKRNAQLEAIETLEKESLKDLETKCAKQGFALTQVQEDEISHIDVLPTFRKKPIEMEELCDKIESGQIKHKSISRIKAKYAELKEELRLVMIKLRLASRELREKIRTIEQDAVREEMKTIHARLNEKFPFPNIAEWLEQMTNWLTDHLDAFSDDEGPQIEAERRALRHELEINVILDNAKRETPPIIYENSPTFTNLFGTVNRPTDETRQIADFSDIKAGSILRAHGGYLVISANDAANESGVWRTLTRVLKAREIEIQSPEQFFSPGGGSSLKPRAIPIDVKVIAVGDDELYRALYNGSDDFRRVFKIKADFDDVMPRTTENVGIYARHAFKVQNEEHMRPIDNTALAALAEYGVRIASRQEWLSTRFSELTDVLREADHYAKAEESDTLNGEHVKRALKAKNDRHCQTEDRLRHLIDKGLITINTEGEDIGISNALTVVDIGDHAFGQPCRISATSAPGHDGVLSVEREVCLSGRLHDKGTMLIIAYLRSHYLPEEPVALSATVAFEQLHDEVDGDSASVAESMALISNLAQVPLNQAIAMTGALDQCGHVQAVGGLNEKIEGFFHICESRGLTGQQGIVLPDDNRLDLVLADEVIQAVKDGKFHIWTVRHLDEVIEILTGETAGKRQADGTFPAGSVNARVEQRLRELTKLSGQPKNASNN